MFFFWPIVLAWLAFQKLFGLLDETVEKETPKHQDQAYFYFVQFNMLYKEKAWK